MKFSSKFSFLLVSLILIIPIVTNKSFSYRYENLSVVQTRITDLSWPPESELGNLKYGESTEFSCSTKYEIINNNSEFSVYSGSFPYFIPRINASFVDPILEVGISYIFLAAGGYIKIKEGIDEKNSYINFFVENYYNETLPLGNYTLWYDVTHADELILSPFYSFINVTENQILITHQGINKTLTYPELVETNITNYRLVSTIAIIVGCLLVKRKIELSNSPN